MPSNRKEPFNLDVLLDAPAPITPLPIGQRVQDAPERPYLNTAYLGARLPGARMVGGIHRHALTIRFPCPVCGNDAEVTPGFDGREPFKIRCEGPCTPETVRAEVSKLALLAFELRDDLLYPFLPEFEESVVAAVVDGKTGIIMDREERSKVKRFRGIAPEGVLAHRYDGPSGHPLMVIFRRREGEGKRFLPAHMSVDASDRAEVIFGYPEGLWPIYGWADLIRRPDAPVLAVEGEATADAARSLFPEYVIVTSAAGSNNAGKSDWSPLNGRHVTILRDNDVAGEKYERSVAAHAHAVQAASVRSVKLPYGLPTGWDVADPLPDEVSEEQFLAALDGAVEVRWADVKDALAKASAGGTTPPFRLPDGLLAGNKKVVEAVEQALAEIDPGCGRGRWIGFLGAVHHALGESGLELADAWSRREADKHGKYRDGEVRQLWEAFSIQAPAAPLPILALFRAAMKESKARAGGDQTPWEPAAAALTTAYIADFESHHRKVREGDNVSIAVQTRRKDGMYDIEFLAEKTVESLYRSRKAPDFEGNRASLFTLWQNNQLTEPLRLVFKPGIEAEPGEFNLFRGLAVQPAQGGSYSLFREHLDSIMHENGDDAGYLWKLIAYRVQNLDAFVAALLVLLGREGGGKSTITRVIARLLAPYSITLSDPEKFVGRNNASLQGKLFVQLEEMILGRKEEYDSRLKHYITSSTLDVEEKFKAQWQIANHLFVAMTANKRSAVRVNEHSRRFAMYEVEDRFAGNQAAREDFFGRMDAELEAGGYEALVFDLLHTDLEGFSPAAVPKTKLFLELAGADADRDPVRGWWRETLEKGVLAEASNRDLDWEAPVSKDVMYNRYVGWCESNGPKAKAAVLSKAEWAKALGKLLPGGLPAKRMMVGRQRGHYLLMPAYEECCVYFEQLFGGTVERAPQPGQLKSVM